MQHLLLTETSISLSLAPPHIPPAESLIGCLPQNSFHEILWIEVDDTRQLYDNDDTALCSHRPQLWITTQHNSQEETAIYSANLQKPLPWTEPHESCKQLWWATWSEGCDCNECCDLAKSDCNELCKSRGNRHVQLQSQQWPWCCTRNELQAPWNHEKQLQQTAQEPQQQIRFTITLTTLKQK